MSEGKHEMTLKYQKQHRTAKDSGRTRNEMSAWASGQNRGYSAEDLQNRRAGTEKV